MGEPSRDEIDLLNLAVRLIQSLRRHFVLLTIVALLGANLGFVAAKIATAIYTSQMIIVSEVLTKAYGEQMSGSINGLIDEGNTKGLAERLELNEADASQLRKLDVSCVVETETKQRSRDIVEKKDKTFFIIKADVTDPRLLTKLQDGLIHFLLHTGLAEASAKERAQLYKPLIDKIDEELRDMESIKLRILEGKNVAPKGSDILMIDPASLFSEIVKLNEQKLEFQSNLDNSKVVRLVEGFTIFDKPSKPKKSIYILVGFLLGGVAGFGFLTLRKLIRLAGQ